MRDILPDVESWIREGKQVALATVVQTWGSAPRRAGSRLAVASDGQFSGSVSGGCVENAVIEAALESIKTGRPRLLQFGVSDETAWEVGLSCGGSLDIFVQPLDSGFLAPLRTAWMSESNSVHITVIRGSEHILGREMLVHEGGTVLGTIGRHREKKASDLAAQALLRNETKRVMLDEETEVFLEFITPAPTLIAVGGVHIAVAMTSLAKTLGYRTVVIDPRGVWGNEERFPHVDHLISSWPEDAFQQMEITNSTAVVILTHDPKLDDDALKIALHSHAFYVGALGSKKTNAQRRERLLAEGMTGQQFARLHAPIGLDIHAQTPEEIALAIMAEVVDSYRKRESVPAAREAEFHSLGS
jgi:xanthine dehydrogenase accessory factor